MCFENRKTRYELEYVIGFLEVSSWLRVIISNSSIGSTIKN